MKNTETNHNNEQISVVDETDRMRVMLDATPLACRLMRRKSNGAFEVFDCNEESIKLFGYNNKQEYMERYFETYPKYQPDGSDSMETALKYMERAFTEGRCVIDFTFQTRDGTLIPSEVTVVRVKYEGEYVIAGYARDMREYRRMMEDIKKHDNVLKTMNEVAVILLEAANEEHFEESLLEGMRLIGRGFESDTVQIWSNEERDDGLHFVLRYKWLSETGKKAPPIAIGTALPYSERWKKLFMRGESVNGPVTKLPREDQDMLNPLGIASTITIPLFYRGEFWGVFCVDNYTGERYFDEGDAGLLRSSALMLVNAINRNLQYAENRLQRMEAETANKAKSNFLSTMSHEIRTPMNAILGIAEIQLQKESIDGSIRETFEQIHASGDLLLGIINDILDLSKIEAGKLDLALENYDIASLISDAAQLNMMQIGSKQIEFVLDLDKEMPSQLYGDKLRVKQILNNLLSNAFKYTSQGTVKLSMRTDQTNCDEGKTMLIVSVSDTGHGMTGEQVDMLFEEYARFNVKSNRTTEGTGLGMSITRNLVQMMDGEFFVESTPGKGSLFTIHLQQGKVGDDILSEEIVENLRHFRTSSRAHMKRVRITREPMPYGSVLIVDDVDTNIYVAKGLLASYELKIDSAANGYEAIEKIQNGNIYDIIFMDHMMPRMDGVETTKRLREMGYDRPIVALTANAVAGQADIFLDSGFDSFVSKPIDIRHLNTVLNKLIRDKKPPEVVEAARKQMKERAANSGSNVQTNGTSSSDNIKESAIDERIAEVFLRDAMNALVTFEEMSEKNDYSDEKDLQTYIMTIHGIKGALANIGQKELAEAAAKLEDAGREKQLETIKSKMPVFIESLRAFVEKLTQEISGAGSEVAIEDEDREFLLKQLAKLKLACEKYQKTAAKDIFEELMKKTWSKPTKEFLDNIKKDLLHSNFEEIVTSVDGFV